MEKKNKKYRKILKILKVVEYACWFFFVLVLPFLASIYTFTVSTSEFAPLFALVTFPLFVFIGVLVSFCLSLLFEYLSYH